jgi:rhamnogalacturonyl hydrolase YesR
MKYPGRQLLLWASIVLFNMQPAAAQSGVDQKPLHSYAPHLQQLHQALNIHFYNPANGYYKEHAEADRNKNPASYLWPLCALIQADNEMELLQYSRLKMDSTFRVILKYYDTRQPAPGYASYPPPLGGGDRFYDDNQWIGIALMDGYFRKKDPVYLQKSIEIYRYMMTAYDTASGGGLYWQEGKLNSKNTCSNGPGVILALQLYKATKQKSYLDTALLLYNWVNKNLKDTDGLYFDNIRIPGGRIDQRKYSYNTGTMMQSAVYLYELTGSKQYLQEAIDVAKAAEKYFYGTGKLRDGYWFNAVLLRGYQHLLQHTSDLSFVRSFATCINYALQNNRNSESLMVGNNNRTVDMVNQAGMLEILARLTYLQKKYKI